MAKLCSVEGCNNKVDSRGFCKKHYVRWRRHGDPLKVLRIHRRENRICSADGCDKPIKARGLCDMHYARLLRHGDINTNLQKQKKLCSVEGCNNVHRAKGYCAHHYNNYRIYGDPLHKNRIHIYACTV